MADKIRASHILVKTETEVNDLISQIDGGADFAALAREHSNCPSGAEGGDLGCLIK
jgi:peptidyl-prolyl cis-trans isomerase C